MWPEQTCLGPFPETDSPEHVEAVAAPRTNAYAQVPLATHDSGPAAHGANRPGTVPPHPVR